MKKSEFLAALAAKLSNIEDSQGTVEYYGEMIDDRMEDGMSEEEAVAAMGSIDDIALHVLLDKPISKMVKEKVRPKRKLKTWETVMLIIGSPLWLPLLVAFFSVALSLYIVLWALVICLYAIDLTLLSGAAAGIIGMIPFLLSGTPGALALLGGGLVCAGLTILMFMGCNRTARGLVKLTKKMLIGLISTVVVKEDAK